MTGHVDAPDSRVRVRFPIGSSASQPQSEPGTVRERLARITCVAIGALAYVPILTQMPSGDLDASWGAVLQYAAREGWQFGPDIAFTYGPLGYLAVPFFAPDVFWWVVAVRMGIGAICGWAFHEIGSRAGWPSLLPPWVLLLLLPPTMASFDVPWVLPAMLWPFLAQRDARRVPAVLICLSMAIGLTALVKFTIAVLATGLAALLSIDDVGRRRAPVAAMVFVSSALVLWIGSGQHLASLPEWLHTSWQMSSAYSEAMSTPVGHYYQRRELLVFAGNALALLCATIWRPDVSRSGVGRALLACALLLLLFVQFKLGFVRHDAHATAAMFAMPMIGVLVAAPGVARGARRWQRSLALLVIVLGLTTYAYALRRYFDRLALPEHYRAYYAVQWDAIGSVTRPWRTHADLSAQRDTALARLRREVPLERLEGSVDVYGHRQGFALAHDLPYRPRPVFQSYGAYTVGLATANRRHVEAADGPRHVLFDVETMDFRYPLMDDAASLPVLLSRFDVRQVVTPFVHLERRAEARSVTLTPLRSASARLGDAIMLDDTTSMVWGQITIRRTALGHLLAAAFKLPPVYLHVTTADGTVRQHRLLREPASMGLLVSPLVTTPEDFVRLHEGGSPRPSQRVTALSADVGWWAAYDGRMDVSLSRLEIR